MQYVFHNILELISLIIAFLYYPSIKGCFMKFFLPFLLFIFIAEAIASLFVIRDDVRSNIGLQYLISIVETIFYGYIFYNLSDKKWIKKVALLQSSCFFLIYISSFFFLGRDVNIFTLCLTLYGFSLSIIAILHIYNKFIDEEYIDIVKDSGFWIAFGISIFFSGISIVLMLHEFILKNNLNLFGIKLYNFIPRVLSIILYSSISIAIILCKKKNKTSLLPL